MIYKNAQIHNIAEIIDNGDGSISWRRVPEKVHNAMELSEWSYMAVNSTGVELRFVLKGESATIRMSSYTDDINNSNVFHVYRGGIQGAWFDVETHKCVTGKVEDFVIERSKNIPHLKVMTEKSGLDWDPEVIRVIFDRGRYRIFDIIGDIEPPKPEQCPQKTLLTYGSSITHGSNSIDMSHTWASVLGHNLNMDVINLGMAGGCAMEPEMADYIASLGEQGKWDIATLELGINVLNWEEEKIVERVENIINEVAGRNPQKKVFVISPFYHCGDDFDNTGDGDKWRRNIESIVKRLNYPNVTYFNGLDILDNMSYMSADEVHPNIYGIQRIADILTEKIGNTLK